MFEVHIHNYPILENSDIAASLDTARKAIRMSYLASGDEQETREIRAAIQVLIEAIEAIARGH